MGDVVVERTLDAPIGVVWKLWTEAEHFKSWYGPDAMSIEAASIKAEVGGKRLVGMASPDGAMRMWLGGEHVEVSHPSRLVYTEYMADEAGMPVPPSAMGMPGDEPHITQVTVELEDLGAQTKMTMTHAGVPADSPGAQGWEQALAKLSGYARDTV